LLSLLFKYNIFFMKRYKSECLKGYRNNEFSYVLTLPYVVLLPANATYQLPAVHDYFKPHYKALVMFF